MVMLAMAIMVYFWGFIEPLAIYTHPKVQLAALYCSLAA
jgi:hypothetical protein